jgi:hypothetical protein
VTTIADKLTGKVVGEPYRGKPDVRFDEGEEETGPTENPSLARVNTHSFRYRADSLLY